MAWFPDSGLLSKGPLSQQLPPGQGEGLEKAAELGLTQRARGQSLRQAGMLSALPHVQAHTFHPKGSSQGCRQPLETWLGAHLRNLPWYPGVVPRANSSLCVQKVNLPLHCCSLFCTRNWGYNQLHSIPRRISISPLSTEAKLPFDTV